MLLCYNNPASHPFISSAEKEYLLKELGQLERDKNQHATPWRDILSNKAVLALIVAWVGYTSTKLYNRMMWHIYQKSYIHLYLNTRCQVFADWSYYIVSVTLPKYMNDVLHFSILDIGTYNSIPWITRISISYVFGFAIDRLIACGRISVTRARKLAVLLGKDSSIELTE